MADEILLNTHHLEIAFAERTLFQDVSFGINASDRIGLVGPNGAGKSTLLKIITGRLKPDRGTVTWRKGLRVGFLEQSPSFATGVTLIEAIVEKCEDKSDAYAQAFELLDRLKLAPFGEEKPVSKLSGGWQKRVALARELILEPDLLLLDEPTNHLDISSILWLEEFLNRAPFAVLMVTHDRLFLQRVVNRVLDLDPRNPNYLLAVDGDYTAYLSAKDQELVALKRHEQVQKNTLRRELEWLSRGAIARMKKQSARIKSAEQLRDSVAELQQKNQRKSVALDFGETEHSPRKLVEARNISKRFGDKILFRDLDLLITPKTRLALLGENGSGKSTLIKILMGQLPSDSGEVKLADGIQISYFEQGRETLRFDQSVLKNICPEGDHVDFQGRHMHARAYLDRFLFSGNKVELPVSKLSGGEQARLRLAQLMLKKAHVLILDEPTNDLDSETLSMLESALHEFEGAVLLVTHDRYFMSSVANKILALPPKEFVEPQGRPVFFADYYQWENWYHEEKSKIEKQTKELSRKSIKNDDEKSAQRRGLTSKERNELKNMEAKILALEAKAAELTARSQQPEIMSDHLKLSEVLAELASVQAELDNRFARWAELEALSGKS